MLSVMKLKRGPNVFGFSADMIRRRSLRTRAIKMLVLDEADEMLNKGEAEHKQQKLSCPS